MNPEANTNILVEELADETLVYDLHSHRAHTLNPTAAYLFQLADGTRTERELAELASDHFGEVATVDVVRIGLERLKRAGLVKWDGRAPTAEGMTRRQALAKLATVGILIPAVMTIVSPTPAQAVSMIPGKSCNLANLGKCCTDKKGNQLCVQNKKGQFKCEGPLC